MAVNCSCFRKKQLFITVESDESYFAYRSGGVQYFQHTLLSVDFDLLAVTVLYRGVVFFHKDTLDKDRIREKEMTN